MHTLGNCTGPQSRFQEPDDDDTPTGTEQEIKWSRFIADKMDEYAKVFEGHTDLSSIIGECADRIRAECSSLEDL